MNVQTSDRCTRHSVMDDIGYVIAGCWVAISVVNFIWRHPIFPFHKWKRLPFGNVCTWTETYAIPELKRTVVLVGSASKCWIAFSFRRHVIWKDWSVWWHHYTDRASDQITLGGDIWIFKEIYMVPAMVRFSVSHHWTPIKSILFVATVFQYF